ncbi:carbohydrate ABC transporter permease [Falsirhodobacter xinxiangensis]|uniref:carbohydrate ABC transporter permease n=1 Tax=Falsirhodobacter xinxiangensis TaxID=2530049 RepID=UPI0010A9AA80|nr:sugar ABC transporter permease [Rhodobacter xinxiangensis]
MAVPRRAWPWLLLLPTGIALGAVAFWPIVEGLRLSLTNTSLITQSADYVGLENYAGLWSDTRFWNAWWHTIWFTFASTLLETLIGLGMALVLYERFPLRGIVRAAMLVPWAMPTVVTSKMFGWLFDGQNGVVNWVLLNLGLIGEKVNWYGDPDTAMTTIIIADVWKTAPFMALLLLTGLQTIPTSLTEAARMDGARGWTVFWHIRLPLLMPTLLISGLFRALDAFRVFDLVYVLTGGGPADSTETLSTLAYKELFSTLEFGYGSTITTAMFLTEAALAAILCLWLVRQIRRVT